MKDHYAENFLLRFAPLVARASVIGAMLVGSTVRAAEPFSETKAIIMPEGGKVPQAPRVTPDGSALTFEFCGPGEYSVAIYRANVDGSAVACLTCDKDTNASYENASWHPTGNYIVYNALGGGTWRGGDIVVAEYLGDHLGKRRVVANGARPQFSWPSGNMILFETRSDTLSSQLVGSDPSLPMENPDSGQQDPFSHLKNTAEISHPILASDGKTVVFAARDKTLQYEGFEVLDDAARQRLYFLWRQMVAADQNVVTAAVLAMLSKYLPTAGMQGIPDPSTLSPFMYKVVRGEPDDRSKPTALAFAPRFNTVDLGRAYALGLTKYSRKGDDTQVRQILLPRLWTTDLTDVTITPLVKDVTSAPLPQKWATISRDGRFAVFEAGLYTERHVYLIAKKNGRWMNRAIQLTEKGSYNSSPELDPKGEMVFFESNREGKSAIWRAKLNWDEINARLAKMNEP